jgi:SAM-dependent methyltransferase
MVIRVNVGCGLAVVPGWVNLDNSPSLLIQRNPLLRVIVSLIERGLGRQLYTRFPSEVYRWDVTRGLPWKDETVEVIYASHFLEHLPRQQAEDFLREAYRVLIPGGYCG